MNRFAYFTSGYTLKALTDLTRAKIRVHGSANIPKGSVIFVINHFTRIETIFLPYQIYAATKIPVWSLADASLFKGILANFLDNVGAVSTRNPDRDLLIVKTLLTGEAVWVIFPEGSMVKDKKIYENGQFIVSTAEGKHRPHTGAATLALRTQFYRERLRRMIDKNPKEAHRIMALYQIDDLEPVLNKETFIVPVNITYYPIRTRENFLTRLAQSLIAQVSERMLDELMTEGTILFSDTDVDIRFGEAIHIKDYMNNSFIESDVTAKRSINFDDNITSKPIMRESAMALMNRYMKGIYNLTTVNHDHLFASILKLMPFETIDAYDWKRRVYIAATLNLDKDALHLHQSLMEDQIHLLTDDRYKKFENFIRLALNTGVVTKKNNGYLKNESKFSVDTGYQRIRIENPLAVIANEIEPLTVLQPHIQRLAFEPAHQIQRRITAHLIEKAVKRFDRAYETYYIDGESKPKPIGMPFLVQGKSKKVGIVLVHGYMAAPFEVKALAEYLGKFGYWVYVPRLAGHGTAPEDLEKRSYMEWVESVEEGYTIMRNICENVIAGGFSAGAGLALDLASRAEDVIGVFAVCPPMRLQDFSAKLVPAVDTWNRLMEAVHLNAARKNFVENTPENPHINYFRNPISGIRQLERLMDSVETKLLSLKTPALVIQSRKDPVVNPEGSYKLFELLGTDDKEYYVFNFERHGILVGEGAERVYESILGFIERCVTTHNQVVTLSLNAVKGERIAHDNVIEPGFANPL